MEREKERLGDRGRELSIGRDRQRNIVTDKDRDRKVDR